MYYEDQGDTPLAYGEFLGDFASEIPANHQIIEVVAGGPKNYGYKLENLETGEVSTKLKVRGFTLSWEASRQLTYDTLKELVHEFAQFSPDNCKVDIPTTQIRRTKDYRVTTNHGAKKYGICYDKRVVQPDLTTRPYGCWIPAFARLVQT